MSGAGANMPATAAVRYFVGTGNALFILRALDIQHIFIKSFIDFAFDRISAFPRSKARKIMGTFGSQS
jgi:hypothetical protein